MNRIRWRVLELVLSLAIIASVGCQKANQPAVPPPAPTAAAWFEDITARSGLNFVHDAGKTGNFFMPQSIGSGAAFVDFDNDGRLDIYLLQNAGPESRSSNRLFRQALEGRFIDVSAGSGLDVAGHGMGAAIGDINNDGWQDVFITEYGAVRIFLNQGNGTFTNVTKAAGIDNPLWGTSASFLDYDRDGWLDLVVANYVDYNPSHQCWGKNGQPEFCGPSGFPPTISKLYRNLTQAFSPGARTVRFEDVTVKSGIARLPGPGLGVVGADFNGDHWPDILIADDAKPNRLWINQKNGTFAEEAGMRGIALDVMGQTRANMGIALGDVNGDSLFDIFVTHLAEESHALWIQNPPGLFHDRTADARLISSQWRGTGFGTLLADFDHNGALDLAIVNGGIRRAEGTNATKTVALDAFWRPYAQRNQLFSNDGRGQFQDISLANDAFSSTAAVSRGLASADLDGDGALDLLVTSIGSPARLYRNVAANRGHWLIIRAIDPTAGGRDAYGAEITLQIGERRWKRWLNPASSFLCSNDHRAHFGLGPAGRIDAIEVIWPDGLQESFPGCSADQIVVLRKGSGRAAPK